jgi:hypothetical protein
MTFRQNAIFGTLANPKNPKMAFEPLLTPPKKQAWVGKRTLSSLTSLPENPENVKK